MIDFYNAGLTDIVPDNFKTSEIYALSEALKHSSQKLQNYTKSIAVYSSVAALPDGVLDLLAVELKTQYYDQKLPRNIKEKLVKQTLSWYRHGGTPSVIEEFVATMYDDAQVSEWFDYEGEPYHFKIVADVSESGVSLDTARTVKKQIDTYKNVRSWLESITYVVKNNFNLMHKIENCMKLCSEFYPRYNLQHLLLDESWNLDDTYLLNGYKSDVYQNFYPLVFGIGLESKVPIMAAVHKTGFLSAVVTDCAADSVFGVRGNIGIRIDAGAGQSFCDGFGIIVDASEELTVEKALYYLDGTFMLDGTKLLEADIIKYEL